MNCNYSQYYIFIFLLGLLIPDTYVLKGLICSLLHLNPSDVSSVEIINPIELGSSAIDGKEFILDINVSLNNKASINLEMQMTYRADWRERSLSYLCRSFDQLQHGAEYGEVRPTIHIGFLNFSPDSNAQPEFYASYRLLNEKSYTSYSDKFILRVVNLTQIDLATEEDKANGIDYWARPFTATSWEDVIMIAKNDSFLSAASQSIYESNADELTRQKCRAREEYCKLERAAQKFGDENIALKQKLAEKIRLLPKKILKLLNSKNYLHKHKNNTKSLCGQQSRKGFSLLEIFPEFAKKS